MISLMVISSIIVIVGIGLGWWLYGSRRITSAEDPDALERIQPQFFHALGQRLYIDEFYDLSVIAFSRLCARVFQWMDSWVWNGAVQLVAWCTRLVSHFDSLVDAHAINAGFDESCTGIAQGGRLISRFQNGRAQNYLRVLGVALVVLVLILFWSHAG